MIPGGAGTSGFVLEDRQWGKHQPKAANSHQQQKQQQQPKIVY